MGLIEKLKQDPPPYSDNASYITVDKIYTRLSYMVKENKLSGFYVNDALHLLAQQISRIDFEELALNLKFPRLDLALDLVSLALYDIIILGDDSGSMSFSSEGRIDDLTFVVNEIAKIATLFDDDGISVRWFNSYTHMDNIKSADQVTDAIQKIQFQGKTPMGSSLKEKVLQQMVYPGIRNKSLKKPVLIFIITDGQPDSRLDVVNAITEAKKIASNSMYGPKAIAFQFGQVGKDREAQNWLEEIDTDPLIGDSIDCTSNFDLEKEEFNRKGLELTPFLWLLKLTQGAIDPEYDAQDEMYKEKNKPSIQDIPRQQQDTNCCVIL